MAPTDGALPEGARIDGALFDRHVLTGPSLEVATRLLGAVLVECSPAGRVAVRLTEVEAYQGRDDPGSHAYRGRTRRTEVMFGSAGHLYVYFTYGMHWCANVVCGPIGEASAVLLRAGEVVEGVPLARARRPGVPRDADLARGPARLTRALGMDGSANGVDLYASGRYRLEQLERPIRQDEIRSGPRVGVSGPGGDATAFPWRFWLDGEPTVSPYRPGRSVRRGAPSGTEPQGTERKLTS